MNSYSLLTRSFHESSKPLFNLASTLLKASKRTQLRNELIKQGPKRPTSAYFLYLQDHRSQFVKENPTLRPAEISKIAGWLMLAATISVALCCSMLWVMRRVVSVKKYESQQSIAHACSMEQYSISDIYQSKQNGNSSEYEVAPTHTDSLIAPEVTYRGFIE